MARLGQIIKTLNIGIGTAVEFLNKKGEQVEPIPAYKLTEEQENLLLKEFSSDKNLKEKSDQLIQQRQEREAIVSIEVDTIDKTAKVKKRSSAKSKELAEDKPEKNIERNTTEIPQEAVVKQPEETETETMPEIEHNEVEKQEKQEKKSKKSEQNVESLSDVEVIADQQPALQTAEEQSVQDDEDDDKDIRSKKTTATDTTADTEAKNIETKEEYQSEEQKEQTVEASKTDEAYKEEEKNEPQSDVAASVDADKAIAEEKTHKEESNTSETKIFKYSEQKLEAPKILGTINLDKIGKDSRPQPKTREERKKRVSGTYA